MLGQDHGLLFLLAERRALEPILPLRLFRNQIFAADAALVLLVSMILLGLAIYLPLFLQGVVGLSATGAGMSITPFLLSITGGATLAGWLIAIRKRYQAMLIVGTFIMILGVFFLTYLAPPANLLVMMIWMVMAGLGIGSIFSVLYLAVQNVLPPTQLGVGSALVRYAGSSPRRDSGQSVSHHLWQTNKSGSGGRAPAWLPDYSGILRNSSAGSLFSERCSRHEARRLFYLLSLLYTRAFMSLH